MTGRFTITPYFPQPPAEYQQRYFADVIRAFEQFVTIVRNPGEGRNTTIVLTDLPTSDAGLEYGTLFLHGTELRVVQAGIVPLSGTSLSLDIGTITVSTS